MILFLVQPWSVLTELIRYNILYSVNDGYFNLELSNINALKADYRFVLGNVEIFKLFNQKTRGYLKNSCTKY